MLVVGSIGAKALLVVGALMAAEETPAATSGDRGSLYVAISGVAVAAIGAFAAIYTSRGKAEPPPVRYVDPPTSYDLTREMAELYAEAEQRAALQAARAEMWEARAGQAGWSEEP